MTEDPKELLFTEHLNYELEMFDEAARFLDSPEFAQLDRNNRNDWFRYNSAIEAFWIHARLLIELGTRKMESVTCALSGWVDVAPNRIVVLLKISPLLIALVMSHL